MRIGPDEYVIIVSKYSLTDNNNNNNSLTVLTESSLQVRHSLSYLI